MRNPDHEIILDLLGASGWIARQVQLPIGSTWLLVHPCLDECEEDPSLHNAARNAMRAMCNQVKRIKA